MKPGSNKGRDGFSRRRTTSEPPEIQTYDPIRRSSVSLSYSEDLSIVKDADSLEELSKLKPYPSTNLRQYRRGSLDTGTMNLRELRRGSIEQGITTIPETDINDNITTKGKDAEITEKNTTGLPTVCLFSDTDNAKNKAIFRDACDITYPTDRHLFVTDMVGNKIHHFDSAGEFIAAYSGIEIIEPWSTCVTSEGYLAFTSRRRKSVAVMSREGDIMWAFGCGFFKCPCGVCTMRDGRFVVSDCSTNRVSIHTHEGRFIKYVGNNEIKEQRMCTPRYVSTSPFDEIIVSDSGNHSVKVFDSDGHFLRSFGSFGKGDGELKTPYGNCCDNLGNVLVADHYNNRVSMFSRNGEFMCHVLTKKHGVCHPKGLTLTPDRRLFVTHGSLKGNEVKMTKIKCTEKPVVIQL